MCKLKEKYKSLKKKGKHGAMYVSTVVKIISCVVIGALVISGLAVVTNGAMNSASGKVDSLFAKSYNYEGNSNNGGAIVPGEGSATLAAGAYDENDIMLYSWDELVTMSKGNISNGKISDVTFGTGLTDVTGLGPINEWDVGEIETLVISDTITTIEDGAFTGFYAQTLVIPDSVVNLGTFTHCGFNDIHIGSGVTNISLPLFCDTTCESVTVSSENPKYDSRNGIDIYHTASDILVAAGLTRNPAVTLTADAKGMGPFSICYPFREDQVTLTIPKENSVFEGSDIPVQVIKGDNTELGTVTDGGAAARDEILSSAIPNNGEVCPTFVPGIDFKIYDYSNTSGAFSGYLYYCNPYYPSNCNWTLYAMPWHTSYVYCDNVGDASVCATFDFSVNPDFNVNDFRFDCLDFMFYSSGISKHENSVILKGLTLSDWQDILEYWKNQGYPDGLINEYHNNFTIHFDDGEVEI